MKEDGTTEKTYQYDRRGNLTQIKSAGERINRYEYGPMNRLIKAAGQDGTEAEYFYNGLGFRTGKKERGAAAIETELNPMKQIDYILDMTKSYHNLLQKKENQSTQSYLWDGNVVGMNEEDEVSYYLQDDLGSPIRLLDVNGEDKSRYGYDEFGNDLYHNQGEVQPFGYTGYQRDNIADTYFAQAREYMPEMGRFGGEDWIKGSIESPITLNQYGYCWGNPAGLVDLDGQEPAWWGEDDPRTWYLKNLYNEVNRFITEKGKEIQEAVKPVNWIPNESVVLVYRYGHKKLNNL